MDSPAAAPSAGPFAVCTHTFEARDPARDRLFPCDIWCPDEPGAWPLVLYSHHSRGNRSLVRPTSPCNLGVYRLPWSLWPRDGHSESLLTVAGNVSDRSSSPTAFRHPLPARLSSAGADSVFVASEALAGGRSRSHRHRRPHVSAATEPSALTNRLFGNRHALLRLAGRACHVTGGAFQRVQSRMNSFHSATLRSFSTGQFSETARAPLKRPSAGHPLHFRARIDVLTPKPVSPVCTSDCKSDLTQSAGSLRNGCSFRTVLELITRQLPFCHGTTYWPSRWRISIMMDCRISFRAPRT